MDASSTTNGNTASATLGDDAATAGSNGGDPTQQAPSGSGNPLAGSSAIFGIGDMSATSSSPAPQHVGQRAGQRHRHRRLHPRRLHHHRERHVDGDRHLGRRRPARSRVDRRCRTWTSPASRSTVDANGITAAGREHAGAAPDLDAQLGPRASSASRSSVTNATDKVSGPSASRTLDGLKISIDLKTLDDAGQQVDVAAAGVRHVAAPRGRARRPAAHPRPGHRAGELDGVAVLRGRQQRQLGRAAGGLDAVDARRPCPAPTITGNSGDAGHRRHHGDRRHLLGRHRDAERPRPGPPPALGRADRRPRRAPPR